MSLNSESADMPAANPRKAELALFDKITKALVTSKDTDSKSGEFQDAISSNRRLWHALESDLSSNGNQLPDELKAQIISLAAWVHKHSQLASKGAAKVDALITVNEAIMKGLAA